jgi:hypothetical protein
MIAVLFDIRTNDVDTVWAVCKNLYSRSLLSLKQPLLSKSFFFRFSFFFSYYFSVSFLVISFSFYFSVKNFSSQNMLVYHIGEINIFSLQYSLFVEWRRKMGGIQNLCVYFRFLLARRYVQIFSTQLRILPSPLTTTCIACSKLLVNKHTNQQVNKLAV